MDPHFITIRSMPDESVSEYIVTRLNAWENKAPNAIHTIGPSLNKKTGMFNIDFEWLDYELLGINLFKDDNPQLVAYKTNLNNYKQKKILDVQTQLGEVGLEKIKLESDVQKFQLILNKLSKDIEALQEKLNVEKLKEKRDDKKIDTMVESMKDLHSKKDDTTNEIARMKEDLNIIKQKESRLLADMDAKDIFIENLEKEIKVLEEKNKKTEDELRQELARKIGTDTIDSRPDNMVWHKIVKPLKVDNNDIVLDRTNPIQALQLCMLMGNNSVALSQRHEDIHNSKLIKPQYFLYNEEKETQVKLVSFDIKKEAYKLCDNLSMYAKKEILNIKGISTWNMSDNAVNSKISDLVETKPDEFISLAKLESQEREKRAFVAELINYKLINERNDGVYYGRDEDDILAYGLPQLIAHIFNPNNRTKLQWFESELNMRKSKSERPSIF